MSAANNTATALSCTYCDRVLADCLCLAGVDAHGFNAQTGLCVGCDKSHADCKCNMCGTCNHAVDQCVCPDYEYSDAEAHPDARYCAYCYSDPCECEKHARQTDINAERDDSCEDCGRHYKHCRCGAPDEDGDD